MRESAQIYDVRMAQFVLKIEKLSHIMVPRGSQYLRSPSPIMAPGIISYNECAVHVRKSDMELLQFLAATDHNIS